MKRIKFTTVIFTVCIAIIATLVSCEKYDKDIEGDINLYLLDDFITGDNSMRILSDGIVLSDTPIVNYDEILEYNSDEYAFKLSSSASSRVDDQFGSAFAVTLEDEIIYTGYFWSSISSATVDWVVIDIISNVYGNVFTVQLGYPWLFDSWTIPDKRNDNRLLSVFFRDGKLKD